MIAHHEHCCILIGQCEERAQLLVEQRVVVTCSLLQNRVGRRARMKRVHSVPHRVMQAIRSNLDHHHEIRIAGRPHVARHGEVLPGHRVQVMQQDLLVAAAYAIDIH